MQKCSHPAERVDRDYQALWYGVEAVRLFSVVACNGAGCHASIAMNNTSRKLAAFIETKINIDPYKEWQAS